MVDRLFTDRRNGRLLSSSTLDPRRVLNINRARWNAACDDRESCSIATHDGSRRQIRSSAIFSAARPIIHRLNNFSYVLSRETLHVPTNFSERVILYEKARVFRLPVYLGAWFARIWEPALEIRVGLKVSVFLQVFPSKNSSIIQLSF